MHEAAEGLMLQAMAARGEWKDVQKMIKDLAREQP
ncbi:hypothetical protein X740_33190 [Mesorhizobium sp. LNHC221B00]|nr:hypothetical protein X740_33190 [Mesorhizobium sp. LNHC221B00]